MKSYVVNKIDFTLGGKETVYSTFDKKLAEKIAMDRNRRRQENSVLIFIVSECEHVDTFPL